MTGRRRSAFARRHIGASRWIAARRSGCAAAFGQPAPDCGHDLAFTTFDALTDQPGRFPRFEPWDIRPHVHADPHVDCRCICCIAPGRAADRGGGAWRRGSRRRSACARAFSQACPGKSCGSQRAFQSAVVPFTGRNADAAFRAVHRSVAHRVQRSRLLQRRPLLRRRYGADSGSMGKFPDFDRGCSANARSGAASSDRSRRAFAPT